MKKYILLLILCLTCKAFAFDLNGIWSVTISTNWASTCEAKYSWGTIEEPYNVGFSIDLEKNIIHTNSFRSFYVNFDYDKENNMFSFINPLSKLKETYYIKIISDCEIILRTDVNKNSLIYASQVNSPTIIHYFKIAGPKDAKVLKAPIKAKLLNDIELKFLDYQGVIYDYGPVKKGTIVEVIDYQEGYIPEITDLDFVFHILVNPELGGYVDPKKIEFLDDITINGYGGKRENMSSLSVE